MAIQNPSPSSAVTIATLAEPAGVVPLVMPAWLALHLRSGCALVLLSTTFAGQTAWLATKEHREIVLLFCFLPGLADFGRSGS